MRAVKTAEVKGTDYCEGTSAARPLGDAHNSAVERLSLSTGAITGNLNVAVNSDDAGSLDVPERVHNS